jgi:transposase InsO family protein
MSDNGSAYTSHAYARALREFGLRHLRIKPGRPRTNGCETRSRFRLGPLPGSTPMLLVRDSTKRLARFDAFALSCPLEQLGAGLAPARWPDQKPVRPRA